MKHLSNFISEKQTQLLKDKGAFFAFSNQQFCEQRRKGVRYASIFGGIFCPADQAKSLMESLQRIYKEGIQNDIQENGIDRIIIRELHNYECFYTCDYSQLISALMDYGITEEQIDQVFYREMQEVEF